MTKLMQWLAAMGLILGVWATLLTETLPIHLSTEIKDVLVPLPIYLLIAFACYSLAVIGYRVATFNDCEEAAAELKEEIPEARKDLEKKGFVFS